MNTKNDPNNTKRPIWLQLRAGDLTLSRTSVKEEKRKKQRTDTSIYGTQDDCEGEILVWFEVIPDDEWVRSFVTFTFYSIEIDFFLSLSLD